MSGRRAAKTLRVFAQICACCAAMTLYWPAMAQGQTFVQLTDLGSSIGARLTRVVAQQRISRNLFGAVGTKVSVINLGVVYQLATDPDWARVLIGLKDNWVHEFTNTGGPGGRLVSPRAIDVSARQRVYVADRARGSILIATFDPSAGNLVFPVTWNPAAWLRPIDVAWDGQTSPLVSDYLYILDDSLNIVVYWNLSGGLPGTGLWSYGGTGSGTGQFRHPSAVCVGKSVGTNGGTQFTNYFYVVDRGNHRLVWLDRSSGPSWMNSVSLSNWDPTDCAVDHFGNVYVVDQTNHHIHKFTSYLGLLDTYGTYGKGVNNLNTLAWPHAVSVPCGLKVVNGQTVWYCEGRVLTAEQWSDSSGAVEHYLGIAASIGPPSVTDPSASVFFSSTDNAYTIADVWQVGVGIARTLANGGLWPAGQLGLYWDGTLSNGQIAPDGYYLFRVSLGSAYNCPSGATWCFKFLYSSQFYHKYCVPGGGGGGGDPAVAARPGMFLLPTPPPTCGGAAPSLVAGTGASLGIPQSFGVRQLPGASPALADGLTPLGYVSQVQPSLSVSGAGINTSTADRDAMRAAVSLNGVSSLQINLSDPSAVSVDIFDLAGRLVRQVHTGMQAPGMYVFHWDGSLDGGGRARPGVYLAVVRAQGHRSVSKLVLTAAQSR